VRPIPDTLEDELEDDDAMYNTRRPTSAVPYQYQAVGAPKPPRIIPHPGEVQKIQRQQRGRDTTREERHTEEPATPKKRRLHSTFQAHPILYLGIGMLIALLLWVVGSFLYTYGSNEWNDWHYGRPRTFQIDAVVGHGDSATHPSHFIAVNLNGKVQVIEEPGGEASKAKIYLITQLYGQGANLAPITLTFEDTQHNGKPEMLIHVQDSTIMYLNQNGQFVPQPQQ